jgi:hypothetical protein
MQSSLAAAGQRVRSSKKNPCPLCGRNTDGKCSHDDTRIECYPGDTFRPPADLRRGQVLEIEGRQWAVTSLAGGWSRSHVVLRPDRGREEFKPGPTHSRPAAARRRAHRESQAVEPVLLDMFSRCRQWVQAALGIPEFVHSTLEEIRESRLIVTTAAEALAEMRQPLLEAKRERPELGRLLHAVDVWAKAVGYQRADLEHFWRRQLGTPMEASR